MAAVFTLTGCGNTVDKQKLVELTGDKSFEQVKAAYKTAYFYEKKDEVEVYTYYLKKNEDKVPGFDFEMYSTKTAQDYQKAKKELEEKLQKMRDNLHKITITQLRNEMQNTAFFMGQAKPIDDYIKGLEQLQKDKWAMMDATKKAQREAFEAADRARPGYVEKAKVVPMKRTAEEQNRRKREHAERKEKELERITQQQNKARETQR